jgi:hypothetical protein
LGIEPSGRSAHVFGDLKDFSMDGRGICQVIELFFLFAVEEEDTNV